MIFAELPLDEAAGAVLAHALLIGGTRIPKGTPVDAGLLAMARQAGLDRLWVARAGAEDIDEADAAARIGQALAGPHVEARPPVHGRANLHALASGLLLVKTEALDRANAISEAMAIATLPPFTPVRAGDLLATAKIIPYALPADAVGAAGGAGRDAIEVAPWRQGLRAVMIQTRQDGTADKLLEKARDVTARRLSLLGIRLEEAAPVPHAVAPLSSAIAAARADLLLVAAATATTDRADVVPAALVAAGGRIIRLGMPVDPGNLLLLGTLCGAGGRVGATVIGLPGCARSPKRNGLDLVLERFAAGLPLDSGVIARMGVGGLLEGSGRLSPWGWSG
ncbi:molybdopterin-binding protein [Sandaracinobacteroides sp. A072]|uniref:molybdopterin-binding protein n=1 Tax=Sandaracinobacteroides sp. A072 TaxID=3461146 RepID=UPI0040423948